MTNMRYTICPSQADGEWQAHGAKLDPLVFEVLFLTCTQPLLHKHLELFCRQIFSFLVSVSGIMLR